MLVQLFTTNSRKTTLALDWPGEMPQTKLISRLVMDGDCNNGQTP